MSILGSIQDQAWIIVLVIGVIVAVLTFLEMQLKLIAKIGLSLVRGAIFFLLFYIPLFKQPRLTDLSWLSIVGIILLVCGLTLTIVGGKQLTQTDLKGVTGIPDELITTGLYSRVRHPVNLGLMATFTGWYLIWSGVYALGFLAVFLIAFVLETFWEEKNLEKIFGDGYREYKQQVGMFLPRWRS